MSTPGPRMVLCAGILVFLSGLTAPPAYAQPFAGGSGTPEDPYRIATAEQLLMVGSDVALCDRNFVLTSDIDLSPSGLGGRVFDKAVIACMGYSSSVVTDLGFRGTLDGNGHAVRNLTIDAGKRHVGLFDSIAASGSVRNLRLEDVRIGYPRYDLHAGADLPPGKCASGG